MNAIPYRTTARMRALLASGAVLHTRAEEDDPIEALEQAFEEHNTEVQRQLTSMNARFEALQRSRQHGRTYRERRDAHGNVIIPAHSSFASGEQQDRGRRGEATRSASHAGYHAADLGEEADIRAEREALGEFVRSGGDMEILRDVATRAGMSVDSDPDGGFLVMPVLSTSIQRRQFDVSPMIRLARRVTISTGDAFVEPVDPSDIGAAWVSEKDGRPKLDTAKLKELKIPLNEIYTNQPITQRLLDDSTYNVGAYVEERIADKFARTAGASFINGTGVNQPEGMLSRATSDQPDGVRDYFTIQHMYAVAGLGFAEKLIDLVYLLRAPYRQNARWLMNSKTAGFVRKLKDGEGNFIWANNLTAGQPALLLGYPVEIDEEMPDLSVGESAVAFGDFQQAYIIVDRPGIRVIVDPYTEKPLVLFYAYTRVGGGIQNGEAVKILKVEAVSP